MDCRNKFPTDEVDAKEMDRWFDDAFPDEEVQGWAPPPKAGLVIFVVSLLMAFVVIAALLHR